MLYETLLSRLFGVLFLTCGPLFEPFFRYGFGRRYFTFGGRILLPLALAILALVARATIPGYAHLPFAGLELGLYNRAALPLRLAEGERVAFAGFAMLFLLTALFHYVWLLGQRMLRRDPTGTRIWGRSWLRLLPGFSRLSESFVQGKVEPLLVIAAGCLLLPRLPAFGLYLMVGGGVFGWDNLHRWRLVRARALDARDAIHDAGLQGEAHAAAQAHARRVEARERGRSAHPAEVRITKRRRPFWR